MIVVITERAGAFVSNSLRVMARIVVESVFPRLNGIHPEDVGRQYLVISKGGHGVQIGPPLGDYVVPFALPDIESGLKVR